MNCLAIEQRGEVLLVDCGVTLSIPLATRLSAKLAWSRGLITRIGGDFQTISLALQYRWFNR